MRGFLFLAFLAACATPEPVGGDRSRLVEGTVVSVDLEPMAYDGDALIELATDAGMVLVRVPARMNLCKASGLELVSQLEPEDGVEVVGEETEGGAVTPCVSPEHRITLLATEKRSVYRGVFESGFETSAFRPCDQPDVRWWLAPEDPDFAERFEAIRQQHGGEGGRGLRLVVETTVVGELTDEGQYGHLGQYTRRLTVTDTRDMVFLSANPVGSVSCR